MGEYRDYSRIRKSDKPFPINALVIFSSGDLPIPR